MTTLDDFFNEDASIFDHDDMLKPGVVIPTKTEYPPAPATGRVARCWTTSAEKPAVGDLMICGRFTYRVEQVGNWEAIDPENGIEEAGWFVRLVSPLLKEAK